MDRLAGRMAPDAGRQSLDPFGYTYRYSPLTPEIL